MQHVGLHYRDCRMQTRSVCTSLKRPSDRGRRYPRRPRLLEPGKVWGVGWNLRPSATPGEARSATVRFPVAATAHLIADTLSFAQSVVSFRPKQPNAASQDSAVNSSEGMPL